MVCLSDLLFCGPAGGAILPVAHGLALDIVQSIVLGEERQPSHYDQSHCSKADQLQDFLIHQ